MNLTLLLFVHLFALVDLSESLARGKIYIYTHFSDAANEWGKRDLSRLASNFASNSNIPARRHLSSNSASFF